jgi:hypothetical protein
MNIQLKSSFTCSKKLTPISVWAHLFSVRAMIDEGMGRIVTSIGNKNNDRNTGKAIAEFVVRNTSTKKDNKFTIETDATAYPFIRHECNITGIKENKTLLVWNK